MDHPVLQKPPIVEGLIDLRVRTEPEFDASELLKLSDELKDRYPDCHEARRLETMVEFQGNSGSSHSVKAQKVGYRLDSADKLYVFQAQTGGFTLSRLAPYETWARLRNEAHDLWGRYVSAARPSAVTRVAVRYINRIELPLPITDFDEYLGAPPNIPRDIPQMVSQFFSRVIVFDQVSSASIVVTQAIEPADLTRNVLPLILDIDVAREDSFDPAGNEHWDLLDRLRDLKNNAFFGSLTDKALEIFK